MASPELREPWAMTDAELIAEARALQHQENWDAASDPAHLLRHLNPGGYWLRPHTQIIASALSDLAKQHDSQKSVSGPRLLIEEPPQTGKTVTGVVGAAFWWLIHHPNHRIVIGSYGDALAVDRGQDIKKLVEEHGSKYGLALTRGSTSKQDWRLTTGGGVKSVGVGSGIAGYPADLAIIDDPHKNRQEADGIIHRERVWRWFSADITSRLAPGAPVIIVMTPWHPDDIAARLIVEQGRVEDGGSWQVLRMPAFCDDPEHDPLGRQLGDPLPHPKIKTRNREALIAHWNLKRETSTVQDWSSLYMCNPKPVEGALLQRSLLRERRCYMVGGPCHPCDQKPTRAAVAVDPSGGGRDTAGIVGGYLGSDKRLYITHDLSGVMPSDQWARKACELAVTIDADHVVVENNFGGDMGKLAIRTAWDAMIRENTERYKKTRNDLGRDRTMDPDARRSAYAELDASIKPYQRLCPRISSVRAKQNKRLRAEPIAQQWLEDRIRTASYLPELEEEWATWQADLHESPGRIDASVYLAYDLLPVPGAGQGTVRKEPTGTLPTSSASPLSGSAGGFSSLGPLG
jgi:hypothetical protein